MKRALLVVTPELLLELFKLGPVGAFKVTTFALPDDARAVDVRYINSKGQIAIEVESESFNELPGKAKQPVLLPSPVCRVFSEDELLARLAAKQESEVLQAPETSESESVS